MKYFTFTELERSEAAVRYGLDNTAPDEARANMARLVDELLDPLRQAWGRPLHVNSGYRSAEVNRIVGGVSTSHHLRGMAADITTGNSVDNRRLYELAQRLGLRFTQMIGRKYDFAFVHLSYEPGNLKGQLL